MRKEYKFLLFIFVFAFVLRFIFSVLIQVRFWDETIYLDLAKDLSSNFFHYSLSGSFWSDYIPFGNFPYSWPNIGFRAPLLPYTLSFFYLIGFPKLAEFFCCFIGATSCVLIYFLGKKIFNQKVGIYSSIFLSIIPLHLLWSARVSTGVYGLFLLLLSFLFFWMGFEENKNYAKILFGVFLSFAILARYTILWVIPVFLIYFLIRDKNFRILKDKYLWFSILAFLIVMIPWFIYGAINYGNLFGPFIHGTIGSGFWGGVQSPLFYFKYFFESFSSVGILFIFSLVYLVRKKEFSNKKIYLFLIWFFLFFIFALSFSHKEMRFLIPLIVPLCILSGFFSSKINFSKNKYWKIVLVILFVFYLYWLVSSFIVFYGQENSGTNICFSKGMEFVKGFNENVIIYTDEPPIVYSYTGKETRYFPNPWDINSIKEGSDTYILYTDYDKPLYLKENVLFREDLKNNFEEVFSCDYEWGITEIYRVDFLKN